MNARFRELRYSAVIWLMVGAMTAGVARPAGGEEIVLFDSGGFADQSIYPLGALRAVDHGASRWTPAAGTARPGEIVALDEGPFRRALRRHQTGQQPTDAELLDFPPAAATRLTISFDLRVSTAESRTLDVFLLRPGQTGAEDQASSLLWGHIPGQLGYFDGKYRELAPIDTGWHRYEIIHDLAANTFAVKIDGKLVGEELGWRNRFAPGTAFGRLRISSIRGEAGQYADLANLRITAQPSPPSIAVTQPTHPGGLLAPDGVLRFSVTSDKPIEAAAIRARLNGEDVTGRLEIDGTPCERQVSLTGFAPNQTYRLAITAENEPGTREHAAAFYTFRDQVDGYRGIWFTLGQMRGEYGDKYSGGLAFCFGHTLIPMAVYAPEVQKTFFVYGGTTGPDHRYLLVMASYYDHQQHRVPRPTIVRDQRGVDDPHDNPSITIDSVGHVWVFVAGRARHRPGQIFRSTEPYSVEAFEEIATREQTYSQIWHVPRRGFFHLLTKYTRGRELYWETSEDGRQWSEMKKLAGFDGHYQTSRLHDGRIGTAFNYHPGGSVDRRTNVYYLQTSDFGQTWKTVERQTLATPLESRRNPALVVDAEAEGRLVYISQLLFDQQGNPVIVHVTSGGYGPGPENDPRTIEITRWTGDRWITRPVVNTDHNYDRGSLYMQEDRWTVIAPALPGPQPHLTGGEVGLWVSDDCGETWSLERQVTRRSPQNHSYIRRPHHPVDPFFAVWADGDSSRFSPSRLYFTDSTGSRLYMLPYDMPGDFAEPVLLDPPIPPPP